MKTILITFLLTCFFLCGYSQNESDLSHELLVYHITIKNKNSKEKVVKITTKNDVVKKLYCETFGQTIDVSKSFSGVNLFVYHEENNRTFRCELKYWKIKKNKMKLKNIRKERY